MRVQKNRHFCRFSLLCNVLGICNIPQPRERNSLFISLTSLPRQFDSVGLCQTSLMESAFASFRIEMSTAVAVFFTVCVIEFSILPSGDTNRPHTSTTSSDFFIVSPFVSRSWSLVTKKLFNKNRFR